MTTKPIKATCAKSHGVSSLFFVTSPEGTSLGLFFFLMRQCFHQKLMFSVFQLTVGHRKTRSGYLL